MKKCWRFLKSLAVLHFYVANCPEDLCRPAAMQTSGALDFARAQNRRMERAKNAASSVYPRALEFRGCVADLSGGRFSKIKVSKS